jgi:hypothetical protein
LPIVWGKRVFYIGLHDVSDVTLFASSSDCLLFFWQIFSALLISF